MAEDYYKEALRSAQKEQHARAAKNEPETLPVLDDILGSDKVTTGVDLGLVQIPAELIAGTKSRGRASAFAPNFMPIMEEGTEFAEKWKRLCDAHLTEGIRDPVKAYEYMNRYYIEEGNKRVSVLKFFDAVNIPGTVTRILPERNGDEAVELYYELLAFSKYSHINFIEFSAKGSYTELLKVLGKEPSEEWTEDEQKEFSAVYYYFKKAYFQSGGDKLNSTVGDAMLRYVKVYGYQELKDSDIADIKKNLSKMWEDVALQSDETPIELKLDPDGEKKTSVFSWFLPFGTPSVLKVAFLYDGTPQTSGWVHDHERGRVHIQRVFDNKIETKAYLNAMDDDPLEIIEEAIAEGTHIIFTTSPRFLQASLRAAVEHPETVIMNCSLNKSHRYIRTYYTRMYEAKFILGAIAGSLTESDKLGYVCDYPIYGQIAGINAFALGAQMANPRAKVYLEWSATKGASEAAEALTQQGIHLLSSQDTSRFRRDDRSSFGLSYVKDDVRDLLVNPTWKWGIYYEKILRNFLDKSLQNEYQSSSKAINYYWGMSSGVVDIIYSDTLPHSAKRFGEMLKNSIIKEVCNPFMTPLYKQNGERVGSDKGALTPEEIISMDYLVENVVGTIPKYDELSPMGKATVDMAGVEGAQDSSDKEPEPEEV